MHGHAHTHARSRPRAQANVCRTSQFLARTSSLSSAGVFGHGAAQGEGGGGGAGAGDEGHARLSLPVFLPLLRHEGDVRGGLVAVMSSVGEVAAVDERGQHLWQVRGGSTRPLLPLGTAPQAAPHFRAKHFASGCSCTPLTRACVRACAPQDAFPVAWHAPAPGDAPSRAAPHAPTLAPLALHAHGRPTALLAAGSAGAVVVSEHGRVLASLWLPHAPAQPLVAADFNGDGLTDVMAVTPHGTYAWAQVGGGAEEGRGCWGGFGRGWEGGKCRHVMQCWPRTHTYARALPRAGAARGRDGAARAAAHPRRGHGCACMERAPDAGRGGPGHGRRGDQARAQHPVCGLMMGAGRAAGRRLRHAYAIGGLEGPLG